MSGKDAFTDLFAPEIPALGPSVPSIPWKVLLVDDEPDIHAVLHLALEDASVEGRPLQLLSARSGAEARIRLAEHPDIALILLDVVMETERAGLELVRHVRRTLCNHAVQIVIVTGQPGYAPQREVVTEYEIDGYRLKSELSADKIFVTVYAALRTQRVVSELDCQTYALQQALAEAQRFRRAMDLAPSCIYLKDRQYRYVYANHPTLRLYGVDEAALMAFDDGDFLPPAELARVRAVDDRIFAGETVEQEVEVRDRAGVRRVFWEIKVPIYLDSTRTLVWGVCGIATDITDRKQAEEELARHRLQLENLVAARTRDLEHTHARLADTQFAMDRVGIGVAWNDIATGRFLYANDEACRQLGYARDELLTKTLPEIAPLLASQSVGEITDSVRARGSNVRLETEHLRKDGTRYPVEVTVHLHGDPGHEWFIAFYTDITQRKLFEAELIQARDAAEAASRAKSTFLANMSHELRTPMNAIMGLTGLALRRATDEKLRNQLVTIDQASHHLLQVINNILDISKVEADHLRLEQVEFRVGEVLENLQGMVGAKAAEKGLQLKLELAPGIPGRLLVGDPLRLGQLLLNLVGNAIKFTARGCVTLRATIVEETTVEMVVRWEVVDNGIGISPEDQRRLFTAFEQADGSMTRRYGGTGLGLAISKRLAHLMGGEIGVVSAPDQGSTFWFTVRLGKAAPEAFTTPAASADRSASTIGAGIAAGALEALRHRFAGARVLLAEDEPVNREVSSELLKDAALATEVAEDGAIALQLARSRRYDLILMDMQMPNLNGLDATRAIRADSLNRTTPIIAMTANAFSDDRAHCMEAGMNDHVGKPVEPALLYETLLRWLARPA